MPHGIPSFPATGRIANGTGDGKMGISDTPSDKELGENQSSKPMLGKKKKRRRKYNTKKIKGL
jgi:hypothetical protein